MDLEEKNSENRGKEVKNQNHYLEGEIVVKLVFSESNRSLEDCLRAILKSS